MTSNAEYVRVIKDDLNQLCACGGEIAGWLESLSEELGEDDMTTVIAVSNALRNWQMAIGTLSHNGSSG
jgi:hypothetical protein